MKKVLILGATSTIGEALAQQYASRQFHLYLAARQGKIRLQTLKKDLEARYSTQVHTYDFEARDFDSHEPFYHALPDTPDIVICLFGYLGNQELTRKDFDEARRVIETNLLGSVSILNIVANDFEEKRSGSIVGVSSVAGERGRQSNYVYGCTKAGFTSYLSGLRNRLHDRGVRVLTVKPGYVYTTMTKDLKMPAPLVATASQVARDMIHAEEAGKDSIYTLWFWRWIMWAVRNIPEPVFKRLKL